MKERRTQEDYEMKLTTMSRGSQPSHFDSHLVAPSLIIISDARSTHTHTHTRSHGREVAPARVALVCERERVCVRERERVCVWQPACAVS